VRHFYIDAERRLENLEQLIDIPRRCSSGPARARCVVARNTIARPEDLSAPSGAFVAREVDDDRRDIGRVAHRARRFGAAHNRRAGILPAGIESVIRVYAAAKGGNPRLTSVGGGMQKYGITVNAISRVRRRGDRLDSGREDAGRADLRRRSAARCSDPANVAPIIIYLASDEGRRSERTYLPGVGLSYYALQTHPSPSGS